MKNGQAQKAGLSSKVPAHMTMNGSIFKANTTQVSGNFETSSTNKTASTRQSESLLKANTTKSVEQASKTGSSQRSDRTEQKTDDKAKRIDISNE